MNIPTNPDSEAECSLHPTMVRLSMPAVQESSAPDTRVSQRRAQGTSH